MEEGYKQSDLVNHLVFDPQPFAYIDRAFFPGIFCQDLSPEQAAALHARAWRVEKRGRAVVSVRAPIDTGSPGSSLAW